jgi:predicted nucleic acid-binding protein
MKIWLLDTGPLVAYLDRADPEHRFVAERLDAFSGQFCTTSAVITESMHFVSADSRGPSSLLEFLLDTRAKVFDHVTFPQLADVVTLMEKYRNGPMDYADATLVNLAARIHIYDICTLDRRGFATYRTRTGKHFKLVLD